jgi:hypothetical protein
VAVVASALNTHRAQRAVLMPRAPEEREPPRPPHGPARPHPVKSRRVAGRRDRRVCELSTDLAGLMRHGMDGAPIRNVRSRLSVVGVERVASRACEQERLVCLSLANAAASTAAVLSPTQARGFGVPRNASDRYCARSGLVYRAASGHGCSAGQQTPRACTSPASVRWLRTSNPQTARGQAITKPSRPTFLSV